MFRVIPSNGLSDRIEQFILNAIEAQEERMIVIKRKDIAEKMDCAPSQVTYVVNTRFTPREGFYVESKRGANGFIRIAILKQTPAADEEKMKISEEKANRDVVKKTTAMPTELSTDAVLGSEQRITTFFRKLQGSGMVTMRECTLLRNVMQIMLTAVPQERREQMVSAAFMRILQILREGR